MSARQISKTDEIASVLAWLRDRMPPDINFSADSRLIQPGDVFVAYGVEGGADNRLCIGDALARGAAAVLYQPEGLADPLRQTMKQTTAATRAVPALDLLAGPIVSAWYGAPSEQMQVFGVTGTNGKTSCAQWIAAALEALGTRCATIGTLGSGFADQLVSTGFTTPLAPQLQSNLARLYRSGARAVAIEVTSHALAQGRVNGTAFDVAVFTNLTQDHLDYHHTLDAYEAAKARLFAWPGLACAVVNRDDAAGRRILSSAAGRVRTIAYGLGEPDKASKADAMLAAFDVRPTQIGTAFSLHSDWGRANLEVTALGAFNVSNLLSVLGALLAVGTPFDAALAQLGKLKPVIGRMQQLDGRLPGNEPLVIIDFAHTPDALEKTLDALRPVADKRQGKLICMFGCGGDRDTAKRPLMGAIAEQLADAVVLTSDNPRSEPMAAIIDQIAAGMREPAAARRIEDRASAILKTIRDAAPEDVVVLAGRGHETVQEIMGKQHPFSDQDHARLALAARIRHQKSGTRDQKHLAWQSPAKSSLMPASMYSLSEAASFIPGAAVLGDGRVRFNRVITDSRLVRPGDLFVALKGERFDAHDFLAEAAARGAAAVLVSRSPDNWRVPTLRVADTRAALGALAHGWRQRFALPLVAVTGSNGKTTVKQMIASIFAAAVGEHARLANSGNFNNEIGLPLTLFRLTSAHRLAVVEFGMNHPGETAILARLAAPTIALINNAQREHQEFMATVEAVALEHASAIHALPREGSVVFPADDAYAPLWRAAAAGRRIIDFALATDRRALDPAARCAAVVGQWHGTMPLVVRAPIREFELTLRLLGEHNARNALAATAAAHAAGVPLAAIKAGLEACEPVDGRLQTKVATIAPLTGIRVIDDTYNANPDSMRAAIDVLAALPAPRALVIGDMAEVGESGPAFHHEIGAYARERGIDALFAVGEATPIACAAFGPKAAHYLSVDALVAALIAAGPAGVTTLLVKGSRSMRMERIVNLLVDSSHQSDVSALHWA